MLHDLHVLIAPEQPYADIVLFGDLNDGFQVAVPSDDWESAGSPEAISISIEAVTGG